MKRITEEMHLEKEWFEEAKKQTPKTVAKFVKHVMNDYEHDYGTVVHAISACALAAAYAANKAEGAQGGITGFQACYVMWDFVRQWQYADNHCGLKLENYDYMLYPQYERRFDKVISSSTWTALQHRAAELLEEREDAHPDVKNHWERIVNGEVPFGYSVELED